MHSPICTVQSTSYDTSLLPLTTTGKCSGPVRQDKGNTGVSHDNCRLTLVGTGVVKSEGTVKAVSRGGDRSAPAHPHALTL